MNFRTEGLRNACPSHLHTMHQEYVTEIGAMKHKLNIRKAHEERAGRTRKDNIKLCL
jgi:hypothetical protein